MKLQPIKIVEKAWGEERWIYNGEYCGKLLILKKDHQCSVHKHKIKHETFYLYSGEIDLELNGTHKVICPGEAVVIPTGQYHRFTGIVDSMIIEFSTQHFDSDSYRTEPSGPCQI
jgi:mannose-6-phosphate isomerase-like protein (cupin superfamily)